jgi:hypothetical protein
MLITKYDALCFFDANFNIFVLINQKKATIKHSEYQDTKETKLLRIKII